MLSKLICGAAAVMAASSGTAAGHSIHTRQAPELIYSKVNRDSEYGAPSAPSYSAPAPSYSAPAPSYSAPAPSYSAPETGYASPSTGYGAAPSYGAEEEAGLDLTSIIIPLLALVGLSLLFPTYVSLTTVRKRRDAGLEPDVNPMTDVVERVNDIYSSVVQSEECMERIACEIGGLAADVGLKQSPAVQLAGGFVPSKYKAYYKQFASGKDCHKIKCL